MTTETDWDKCFQEIDENSTAKLINSFQPARNKYFNVSSIYDSDKIPPDWKIAENHAVNLIFFVIRIIRIQEGLHLKKQNLMTFAHVVDIKQQRFNVYILKNREPLKLNFNPNQLTFLGSGYPLYFSFIKTAIILICI